MSYTYPRVMFTRGSVANMKIRCRLCFCEVASKCTVPLFGHVELQQDWPSRLRKLLHLPVSIEDELPQHICRSCSSKVETVERKLQALRQQARESVEKTMKAPRRKRGKDTSSETGVSPSTAKARPPAKRMYTTGARQLFPSVSEESSGKTTINLILNC